MASYTVTVNDILRGYSDLNNFNENNNRNRSQKYHTNNNNFFNFDEPWKLVDKTYQQFFNFDFYFNVFPNDNEANKAAKIQFEKRFMLHFYLYEIGYETPGAFKLALQNWLNEYMPLYSQLLAKQQTDIFVTNEGKIISKNSNTSKNKTLSNSQTAEEATAINNTNAASDLKTATTDTPQNNLGIDVDSLGYASQAGNNKSTDEGSGAQTNSGRSSANADQIQDAKNDGTSENDSSARNRDIFDIIKNWTDSNYSTYLDIFDKIEASGMFMMVY